MEALIEKICLFKNIPKGDIDFETTSQLICGSTFPAVQLNNGDQISFEDIIPNLDKEIFRVNSKLANLNIAKGVFHYKYNDSEKTLYEQDFLVTGTYEDFLTICVNVIKDINCTLDPDYVSNVTEMYAKYMIVEEQSTFRNLDDLLNDLWKKSIEHFPKVVRHTSMLPFEDHFNTQDLIKLILDNIFQNLYTYNSIELYVKIYSQITVLTTKLNESGHQFRANDFMRAIIAEIGNNFIYRLLHTDDLNLCGVQFKTNDNSVPPLSDDDLLKTYSNLTTFEDQVELQIYAADLFSNRAYLTMLLFDQGIRRMSGLALLPIPSSEKVFYKTKKLLKELYRENKEDINFENMITVLVTNLLKSDMLQICLRCMKVAGLHNLTND